VKIDGRLALAIKDSGASAKRLEELGYDGGWSAESGQDPFLPLAPASLATERIQLGTAIAVAFARNPMTLAMMANDLQIASDGRFLLGLGTQVRPHIEKRFSMPWSHPADRMREFVLAMRDIWACWNEGAKLDFRGEFYQHTLSTPFFQPAPHEFGPPKVFLAAVGTRMTEVAGEVADGLLVHPFTTESYLRDVTLPTLAASLQANGRSREGFELQLAAMVVTGESDEQLAEATRTAKRQIAFYGSTPAYRPVLEHSGWGDLQPELNTLSKRGAWRDMTKLIDDDVLQSFAVVGAPDDVADLLVKRFAGALDRLSFYFDLTDDADRLQRAITTIRSAR
jgi:probable F420-dependent oxidoreductase